MSENSGRRRHLGFATTVVCAIVVSATIIGGCTATGHEAGRIRLGITIPVVGLDLVRAVDVSWQADRRDGLPAVDAPKPFTLFAAGTDGVRVLDASGDGMPPAAASAPAAQPTPGRPPGESTAAPETESSPGTGPGNDTPASGQPPAKGAGLAGGAGTTTGDGFVCDACGDTIRLTAAGLESLRVHGLAPARCGACQFAARAGRAGREGRGR